MCSPWTATRRILVVIEVLWTALSRSPRRTLLHAWCLPVQLSLLVLDWCAHRVLRGEACPRDRLGPFPRVQQSLTSTCGTQRVHCVIAGGYGNEGCTEFLKVVSTTEECKGPFFSDDGERRVIFFRCLSCWQLLPCQRVGVSRSRVSSDMQLKSGSRASLRLMSLIADSTLDECTAFCGARGISSHEGGSVRDFQSVR